MHYIGYRAAIKYARSYKDPIKPTIQLPIHPTKSRFLFAKIAKKNSINSEPKIYIHVIIDNILTVVCGVFQGI